MSITKRKGSKFYWYSITINGKRFRDSTRTTDLEKAKAIEAKIRLDELNKVQMDIRPSITLDKAFTRYLDEHVQYLKTWESIATNCKRFLDFYGNSFLLSRFSNAEISRYISIRRKQVKNASVNRELATIRHFLRKAEYEWEYDVGKVNFRLHMLKEPECRVRYLTVNEARNLINCASDHLQPIISFALLTGLRRANILGLKWEDIDFEQKCMNFIIKSNIPNGKRFRLPITEQIRDILLGQEPKECGHVFTFKGRPIKDVQTSFNRALKKANISNFRFHDLRHTAATWLLADGMPIDMVQRILAHTQINTTMKYAHRIDKDLTDKFASIHAKSHFGHSNDF